MLKWLWRFFRKKEPPPKKKLDRELLTQTAVRCVVHVAASGRYIGADKWGEIDACAEAMKMFVTALQDEYELSKGNLTMAHKVIHQHKWMILTGRFI